MTTMTQCPAFAQIQQKCQQLFAASNEFLLWQPDDRYLAVTTNFDISDLDRALKLLVNTFGWGKAPEDLHAASERLLEVIEMLGGLARGQIIFSFEPDDAPLLYAAWWPWGNGSRISIRIGLHLPGASAEQQTCLEEKLSAIFTSATPS